MKKYRTHAEVLDEFAAFEEEALAEVRAHRLADVRQQHGLTQTDVANRLHITQTAVSKPSAAIWLAPS